MSVFNNPPSYYEDKAIDDRNAGNYLEAAEWWLRARTVSAGHKRRDRYEQLSNECIRLHKEQANAYDARG